jgi:hypothetical protein
MFAALIKHGEEGSALRPGLSHAIQGQARILAPAPRTEEAKIIV